MKAQDRVNGLGRKGHEMQPIFSHQFYTILRALEQENRHTKPGELCMADPEGVGGKSRQLRPHIAGGIIRRSGVGLWGAVWIRRPLCIKGIRFGLSLPKFLRKKES